MLFVILCPACLIYVTRKPEVIWTSFILAVGVHHFRVILHTYTQNGMEHSKFSYVKCFNSNETNYRSLECAIIDINSSAGILYQSAKPSRGAKIRMACDFYIAAAADLSPWVKLLYMCASCNISGNGLGAIWIDLKIYIYCSVTFLHVFYCWEFIIVELAEINPLLAVNRFFWDVVKHRNWLPKNKHFLRFRFRVKYS